MGLPGWTPSKRDAQYRQVCDGNSSTPPRHAAAGSRQPPGYAIIDELRERSAQEFSLPEGTVYAACIGSRRRVCLSVAVGGTAGAIEPRFGRAGCPCIASRLSVGLFTNGQLKSLVE